MIRRWWDRLRKLDHWWLPRTGDGSWERNCGCDSYSTAGCPFLVGE